MSIFQLREKEQSEDGAFNIPYEAFLVSSRIRPLYESKTAAGKAIRGVSEDGITIFSYYPKRHMTAISTRFADGRSIVTFDTSFTKKHTLFLKPQPDLADSWRIHRAEVRKRLQEFQAIERATIQQHMAYEKFWAAFFSSILLPIFNIFFVLMILIFLFNAFYL